jgi:cardiolipin synthase A/B
MSKLRGGHEVHLLEGSRSYFPSLISAIDSATQFVDLETYIFDCSGSGQEVAQALARAASRGVSVRVVMDAVGTHQMHETWLQLWRDSGVKWQFYKPTGWMGLLRPGHWRRLHRKLCVIDQQVAYCGGINIIDDFYDPRFGWMDQPRLDFTVRVTGPLVLAVQRTMETVWWRAMAMSELRSRELRSAWQSARASNLRYLDHCRESALSLSGIAIAGLVLRDNLKHRRDIERMYLQAIAGAKHEICIANAYFLPGIKLRRALIRAAARGVKVKLLLQGRKDQLLLHYASQVLHDQLLQAGVEIHEYVHSFVHAKVAVIDARHEQAWATVGSSNLDPLSLLLAREANVVVRDRAFARQLERRLLQAIAEGSRPVCGVLNARRSLWQRALQWISYGLIRAILGFAGQRY